MSSLRLIIVLLFMLMIKQGGAQTTGTNTHFFPNAVCDSTYLQFTLAENDTVTLVIYNRWGVEVRSFFSNTPLPAGSYSILFNRDSLPNGVYTLVLLYGDSLKVIQPETVVNCHTTDLNEPTPSPKLITLYPNPTSDLITIDIEGEKIITIENLLGQICKTITTTGHTISIADLPNGNYVATILTPQRGQIAVGKIIKQD